MKMRKWIEKSPWIWPLLGSLILWIAMSVITGHVKPAVLIANLTLTSYLVFLSLGQTAVMTGGDGAIDLSIQYTLALAAYLASIFMPMFGIIIGFVLTLAVCSVIGVINGLINLYIKVPPMITTLAVGYIVYSGVLVLAAQNQGVPHPDILYFSQNARIFGLSPIILLALAVVVFMCFLMYRMRYGRYLHAIGQNRRAAKLAGIKVNFIIIMSFVISSVLAGISGIFLGGYFGGAFQDMGMSYMLLSISATVIGGTSAGGGKSSVVGSLFGAFMLMMLVSFLNISGLPPAIQELIQGVLLVSILVVSVPKKQVNI